MTRHDDDYSGMVETGILAPVFGFFFYDERMGVNNKS